LCKVALHVILGLVHHLPLNLGYQLTFLSDKLSLFLDAREMLIEEIFLSSYLIFVLIIHLVMVILVLLTLLMIHEGIFVFIGSLVSSLL
jgi:hypothetical protein